MVQLRLDKFVKPHHDGILHFLPNSHLENGEDSEHSSLANKKYGEHTEI